MPIDYDKKLVFIHIPKTGGTSIELMFGLVTPAQFCSRTPISSLMPPTKSPQHFTWLELRRNLPSAFLDRTFRFAFVRNPWDRFVSEYFWRRTLVASYKEPRHLLYDANDLSSLEAFTRVLALQGEARVDALRGFDGHLETQLSFIINDRARVIVDFLGRFENFDEDVRKVAAAVRQPVSALTHINTSNRSREYRQYYSVYAREVVAEFYKEDIETFGYDF